MDNSILSTVGLALKAGRLAVGEDPAGDACRAHDCRLLLTAGDASEPTLRRAGRFAETGGCLTVRLPCTREELGGAVGRSVCAVAAVTDLGFARAIAGKLAAMDPAAYGETARQLAAKAERAARRREAQRQRDKQRSRKKKFSE